jgi:DNA-binding transcriptional regulator YiaG
MGKAFTGGGGGDVDEGRLNVNNIAFPVISKVASDDPSSDEEGVRVGAASNGSSQTRLVILHAVTFAKAVKDHRTRFFEKQTCFAQAIGCTEAAVSYWETGRRLPQPKTLQKILEVLAMVGVSPADLLELQRNWESARSV